MSAAESGHRALRQLRWRMTQNLVRKQFASARLRLAMVVLLSLIFWSGLYWIFRDGFLFLSSHQLIAGPLLEMLFRLFFASLLVMLVFSTGIILYASLFASREAEFLLGLPIGTDQVFAFKFAEAMFFSCWGFFLLGSPLMLAYGMTAKAPPLFYVLAAGYFVFFAFIPGSLGAIACLVVTRLFPRRRGQFLVLAATLVLAFGAMVAWRIYRSAHVGSLSRSWLNQLVQEANLFQVLALPSDWMSRGLMVATQAEGIGESLFYLAALLSNALFWYLIAAWLHQWDYRVAYNRAHSESVARRRRPGNVLRGVVETLFRPLPRGVRVLMVKDLRIFLRDPVQWSQVLIFSGLLGFYFLNLGRMVYYTNSPYWRNMIGFFNLAVTGLLLSTYTSRFIYPLFSLEAQKFWILGLCPISREAILWGKFAFASGGALLVTLLLTLLGGIMLQLDALMVVLHLIVVVLLCFGVSAIAVGLGACFPERRESDPSKIAAGFGGTLNLVLSLVFIVSVVAAIAWPCHLYSITLALVHGGEEFRGLGGRPAGISATSFRYWLGGAMFFDLAMGFAAVWIPMRLGTRAFRAMEF